MLAPPRTCQTFRLRCLFWLKKKTSSFPSLSGLAEEEQIIGLRLKSSPFLLFSFAESSRAELFLAAPKKCSRPFQNKRVRKKNTVLLHSIAFGVELLFLLLEVQQMENTLWSPPPLLHQLFGNTGHFQNRLTRHKLTRGCRRSFPCAPVHGGGTLRVMWGKAFAGVTFA